MQRGVGVRNPSRSQTEIWPCGYSGGGVQVSLVVFTTEGTMGQENSRRDQCGVRSDAATVLICLGEEGAELKGRTLDLLVDLRSHPHLWF